MKLIDTLDIWIGDDYFRTECMKRIWGKNTSVAEPWLITVLRFGIRLRNKQFLQGKNL